MYMNKYNIICKTTKRIEKITKQKGQQSIINK